jgi:tRNA-specific 2-thiouridylase
MSKFMKVAVLVSGGVDSSLALKLLHEQGYEVTAFYLKIWLEDEVAFLGKCPWKEDLSYIEALCKQLNVPLHVVSLQQEYWDKVAYYTISQVKAGKTPNPDVLCNQRIKFGAFYDKIKALPEKYDKIATGHYARVEQTPQGYLLKTTDDPIKDQTYFLSHLSQNQLSKALFPIGHLTKQEVRELAHRYDLPSKSRKDSQGICFLGQIKFKEFLRHHLGEHPGDIIEHETGMKLGQHEGFWYHTIGQRKGLKLSGGPWYVVAKDVSKNIVYVSKSYYEDDKKRNQFNVGQFNWITSLVGGQIHNLQVKIRHGETRYDATLELKGNTGVVKINGRDQGIAAGQFAVFYNNDICLGCGTIENIL